MASDLTLLYYTANRLDYHFGRAVIGELAKRGPQMAPIVAVSHSRGGVVPVLEYHFGHEDGDCRLDLLFAYDKPFSIWQVYQNVLTGAKAAKTPYVACCEDDTVYAPSHFTYRPALDTFAYDRNRWVITRRLAADGKSREAIFYWRERHQLAMCIAPRELLIETLEERFAKYPQPVPHDVAKKTGWGEPGRYEKNLGLTRRKMEYFDSPEPSVTFNHSESLMGRRQVQPTDIIKTDLPPWGNATELWNRIHG